MSDLVQGKGVVVTPGAVDDKDRYGRIPRYVDVDGTDAGLAMIQGGYAIARYDSRDGYGHHPRKEQYVAADSNTSQICASPTPAARPAPAPAPAPTPPTTAAASGGTYANCSEARAAGVTPIHRGEPGYSSKLDGDGDGIACE